MKPFHKHKYRFKEKVKSIKYKSIAFFLFTFSFLLFQFLEDKTGPKVIAFVIDSSSSMMTRERNILDLFEDLTHGQVVSTILKRYGKPDELHLHPVDNAKGGLDHKRYLNALALVRSYLQDQPDDRVVVNISLGSYSPRPQEKQLIRDILEHGAIVVAAAGNDGVKDSIYPAALDGVICVGASGNGFRKDYSNYGNIDIFADGNYRTSQMIILPSDTGIETHARRVTLNGTSFAAPRVSGLIVKMLRLEPSLESQQILEILQNTADDVVGFEQGSVNRLNALAVISGRYAALRNVRRAFLVVIEAVCIMIFVCVGLLVVIPVPELVFRMSFPARWTAVKIRRIDKITAGDRKRPRDIRYIINCLFPGYIRLFERAKKAILEIGEPAVKHLIRAYPYKASNEFGDFKTCIYNLIEEIGGEQAEEFIRSEQESQDEIHEPDSCREDENRESGRDFESKK